MVDIAAFGCDGNRSSFYGNHGRDDVVDVSCFVVFSQCCFLLHHVPAEATVFKCTSDQGGQAR